MQLLIVPKQAYNVTEGLPENTVLQHVVISCLEASFSPYLGSSTPSYIKLFRILYPCLCRNFIDLELMRSVGDLMFMILIMFDLSFWLFLLQILM